MYNVVTEMKERYLLWQTQSSMKSRESTPTANLGIDVIAIKEDNRTITDDEEKRDG